MPLSKVNFLVSCLFFLIPLQFLPFETKAQKVHTINVEGEIESNYNGIIYLKNEILPGSSRNYSANVVNGKFQFSVDIIEPVANVISLSTISPLGYFYLDTTSAKIQLRIIDINTEKEIIKKIKIERVEGSLSHDIFDYWIKTFDSILKVDQPEEIKSKHLFATLDSLVKLYPDHNIITQALYFCENLSYNQTLKIHNQLSLKQQNRSLINGLERKLERLKKTEIGSEVLLSDLKMINDEPFSLLPNKNSITLIDFWASWCRPCRAKHPEMTKLYKAYYSRGFNIISISLDTEKTKWMEAIEKDKIIWMNASDLKGTTGKTAIYYNLNFIPFNLVIDSNSKIIGKNVSLIELQRMITQYIY